MRRFSVAASLLLLAAAICASQAPVDNSGQTADSAKDFVQRFYDWYVPQARKTQAEPAWGAALKYKRDAFSSALFQALKEDSEAQAKVSDDIVGLDFDPFLNTQDPCDRYEVGAVNPQERGYRVDIYGVCSGKRKARPDVVAQLARQGDSWAFTNFLYPSIHTDLLATLRTLREERQKPSR